MTIEMMLLFQACRAAAFSGFDFPNYFVYGDASKTIMAVPACPVTPATACVATDVDAASTATCSSVKEWYINCTCPYNSSLRH